MGEPETRRIEYQPLPSQQRFHDSTARFKGFSGPIGSGKSQALCQEAIKLSYLNPGRTGLIGAPTYPIDVNQTAFNRAINYPLDSWTPAALTCLKTESFGFTLQRNLDKSEEAIDFAHTLGFSTAARSHLVGIGDPTNAWPKEAASVVGRGLESAVLFALDQFCLIGYEVPLPESLRRSVRMGS